jgi:hypothetical protein
MTVTLTTRADINLDSVFRVAWQRDRVKVSEQALQRIGECRAFFLRLIESDPPPIIYGVTTAQVGMGDPGHAFRRRDARTLSRGSKTGRPNCWRREERCACRVERSVTPRRSELPWFPNHPRSAALRQNLSTQGRSSSSHVQALRGWRSTCR